MKVCPSCNQTYTDETLNFCLNDGTTLVERESDPPPTIFMDPPRKTNPNYSEFGSGFGQPDQQIYQAPYSPPAVNYSQDQTLPIISLILGILSIVTCCYGGAPFGIGAVITGYIGKNNVDKNPQKYGGKGLALGGLIMGAVGLGVTGFFVIIWLISLLSS